MAIITLPAAVSATMGGQSYGQARYDVLDTSDATGATFASLYGPPRWMTSLRSMQGLTLANAGAWEAMLLQLRGRVNHLAVHDHLRPTPVGTLRGTLTTNGTLAIGATSCTLAGCIGTNLIIGGSFEVDANANGVGDGWTTIAVGGVGTPTFTRQTGAPEDGTYEQGIDWTASGTGATNVVGVEKLITGLAPGDYTMGCQARTGGSTNVRLVAECRNAGGTVIQSIVVFDDVVGGTVRVGGTFTAPALTTQITVKLAAYATVTGARAVRFDTAVLMAGAVANTWPGFATLLAGDWLQLGTGLGTSQLVKCTADATGTDAGALTFSFESPIRVAITSGSSVTWNKPVAYYKATNDTLTWQARANGPAIEGFAVDLLEQWA